MNQLENTQENKAAFLNLYAFQGIKMECIAKNFKLTNRLLNGVVQKDNGEFTLCLSTGGFIDFYDIDEWVLPLRSINTLTDEEVVHLTKVFYRGSRDEAISKSPQRYIKNCKLYIIDDLENAKPVIIDELRRLGIAAPFREYSVQDLITNGWIKVEEE